MKRRTLLQRAALWLATKAAVGLSSPIGITDGSWKTIIGEPFSGAWQRNLSLSQGGVAAFSAVYACISVRARAISKLRIKLMEEDGDGIWSEVRRDSPFLGVLRKPNRYQTRIQFLQYWIVTKLLYGNTYVFKDREPARRIVRALYILDPRRVKVRVGDDGSLWYEISADNLSGITTPLTVPASEIIHDRCMPMFHPLVGVSPIYAAGVSAMQGSLIQANSERFFANQSAPSGHLSANGPINDETAVRLRRDFEEAKSGANLGRLLVTGDGMKYEPFAMSSVDAQLIEQLKWTVEDVARPFGVPLHKIMAGALPQVGNMAALDQAFYQDTLQEDIEAIEVLYDEGLELDQVDGRTYGMELDLDGLLRMDPLTRADRLDKLIKASVLSPDEGRASENLGPVTGGSSPMAQQQNYSLAALAKRDAQPDPFKTAAPAAAAPTPTPAANEPNADAQAAKMVESIVGPVRDLMAPFGEELAALKRGLESVAQRPQFGEEQARAMLDAVLAKAEDSADEEAEAIAAFDRCIAEVAKGLDYAAA